jgi:DNA-3-methyladenine glycosylase II
MSFEIRPVAPFDLSLTLDFLRGFGPTRGEQEVGAHEATKAFMVAGRPVAIRVRGSGGGREHPVLGVQLFADRALDDGEAREARSRVEALLTTYEDLTPFYARAAEDVAYAPLVCVLRGLHHVRFPSAFEAACWGVINQRIGLGAARRMKEALVRRAGASIVVGGVEHWAFPEPRAVLELGERVLARLAPGGRRAAALVAVSRAFAQVPAGFLKKGPVDEVRAWLRAIHGVGAFTSSFVLYRGLGRFDGAVAPSPKLVAAAERQYRRSLGARGVARLADGYGEWGGLWMLYLWASTFVAN